jgi:ATP-dependent Lon protease
MAFSGSWFAAARRSAIVTRHLASEAGSSRLPHSASSSRAALTFRTFRSSALVAGYARPSPRWHYPRWVNRDGGDGNDQKPPKTSPGHDPKDSTAWLDGSEDGKSPSSTSSPPSSTPPSDNENPDGFDSPSPPSEPPQSPPPQSPSPTTLTRPTIPENYPQVLALPIARRPLFPGFYKAVVIRNPAVVAAVKEMMKRGQPYIGAFLLKDEASDSDVITDLNAVHEVGVFAQITSIFAANSPGTVTGKDGPEEGLTAVLYPHRRIRITDLVKPPEGLAKASVEQVEATAGEESLPTPPPSPPPESHLNPVQTSFLRDFDISVVNVENLSTLPYNKDDQYIRAFMSEIISVFKDIAQLNPLFRDQITNFSINQVASNVFDEPDKLADFAAAVSTGDVRELQDVLESLTVDDRLRKALLVLKKELINAQLQSKLSRDVDSKIAKRQREYYLMEQLKGIKKELGMESDGKDKLIEKFKERAAQLKMPDAVQKVFDEELSKLNHLEPAASEANVTRNYLEWITQVSNDHE